ncbi:MAG TPA: geranylgeranyl reductase family protein [Solimonas sp.]|nr:geranylgeranyl reductase family protein [Solimonas sp.]
MYDLAIIGGGPAGAAAAYYAARAGLSVCVLERERFPRDKVCGDGLTARAIAVIQDMGLESAVAARAARITRCAVHAPYTATDAPLTAAPGFPDYAYVLPRRELDELLIRHAVAAGAELREGTEVLGWRAQADGVWIDTDGELVCARFALLACGAHLKLPLRMKLLAAKPRMMVAARAYVARGASAGDAWHLDFCRLAAPGYGWVFPVSADCANVGIGFFAARRGRAPAAAVPRYLRLAATRRALGGDVAAGEIKSFPLRVDFPTAPLSQGRVWVIGEAAGLVNPATGEGIDYALESGRMAAQQLAGALRADMSALQATQEYERALHAHYDPIFDFSARLVPWCSRPWAVSALALAARRRPRLRDRLVQIMLGGGEPSRMPDARRILRAVLRG